jgi:hypothetical protein
MKYSFKKIGLLFFFVFNLAEAQINKYTCIKENLIENCNDSIKVDNLEVYFAGNTRYYKYYFSDFEKIFKQKLNNKINFKLQYLGEETHFKTKKEFKSQYKLFFLIDQSKVNDEKNGYDRLVEYELVGKLVRIIDDKEIMYFEIIVDCIHDITNKNYEVIDYIKNKIIKNKIN